MTNKISKILALIVIVSAVVVMVGWIFDITALKSILPQFVTMKFVTAVSFLLSSVSLYCTIRVNEKGADVTKIILVFVNFLIILIMTSLVISIFVGIKTGIEDLFISESAGAINTTVPGRPALATMIAFIFVASAGLLNMFGKSRRVRIATLILGALIMIVGMLAIIGYVVNVPQLYGSFDDISTAMALHTAILFVIIGIGFVLIKNDDKITDSH